jgi:hypothetical protein
MHILIGIAALVALLLLIRTLYYATLLMRPQVDVLKAEQRELRRIENARKPRSSMSFGQHAFLVATLILAFIGLTIAILPG